MEPDNPDAWREAYDIAVASQDLEEAGRRAARLLELYVGLGESALAQRFVREVEDQKVAPLPQRFYLLAAGLAERGDSRWAIALYENAVAAEPAAPAAFKALFRQAQILRMVGDIAEAREAFTHARAHAACTDGFRRAIDKALTETAFPR